MTDSEPTANAPWMAVTGAVVTYSTVLAYLYNQSTTGRQELRYLVKAISAGHSAATTVIAGLALSQKWTVLQTRLHDNQKDTGRLNDSANPWVVGQNPLANFLTAWEAGYLVYDTGALFLIAYSVKRSSTYRLRAAFEDLLKHSPIFLVHHALLASALLYLQTYVAAGRARGIRIIVAFFLMNASNPLLHLRWWRKKVTGARDRRIDGALAAVFALTRFGTIYWVCRVYGLHHGISSWDAIVRQRWQCKLGTGLLTGFNAIWWLALLRHVVPSN